MGEVNDNIHGKCNKGSPLIAAHGVLNGFEEPVSCAMNRERDCCLKGSRVVYSLESRVQDV